MLNNAVEILWKSALPADWDPPCNRADGNWSKGLSPKSDTVATELFKPVLDSTESGLVARICIPYIWAFFLMLLDLVVVIPVRLGGTQNGGGAAVGCLLFCFPLELRFRLVLLRCFQSKLLFGLR